MSVLARLQRPLNWLADRRLRQLDAVWRDPLRVQEETLPAMVAHARSTVWGREHGFREIRSIADYQRRVPISTYLDFKPLVERGMHGGRDVLWPGRPAQYCKTSGTTAGDKYIPVTREAFRMHRQGGLDTLLLALHRNREGGDARRAPALPRRRHPDRAPRPARRGRRPVRPGGATPARLDPGTLHPGPRDRGDPRLGGAPDRHRAASSLPGPPSRLGHAVLDAGPLRARALPGGCAPAAARAAVDEPRGLRSRRGADGPLPERPRGGDRSSAPLPRGLSGVRGIRGDPGRRDRSRPHAHARLRDLLRVRSGGGARRRLAAAPDHWRGASG